MLISKTYLLYPSQEIAKVYVTTNDDSAIVNLVSGSQQYIYLMHQHDMIVDFVDMIFKEWIEFELNREKPFLLDEIYDEYALCLN